MPEAVFDDTPLAEYLSDVGIEDWGIDESPADQVQGPHPGLRPLTLSGDSTYTLQARFRSLIRSSLLTRISHREVTEFTDQFRYQIVSSNLLEERPIYATWSRSTAERRLDLLFGSGGPWEMLRVPPKYWVGGGGCIVLLVSLFSLKLSSAQARIEKLSLVGTLLISLYLYAHSKRRLLRLLHRKALAQICLFTQQQKLLDGDCVRGLRSIQQSDLIHQRGARKIRSVLCSSMHLLTEEYCDAIKDCLCLCSELDLQRYWEIYDLTPCQQSLGFIMNDDFIGFEQDESPPLGAAACYVPLASLKLQFKKIHFLRRAFLCCLLTANSSGNCTPDELEAWTVITDHLQQATNLSTQICNLLTKERLDPRFKEPAAAPAQGDKSVVPLNILTQHIATRMDLLANTDISKEEYKEHADQLSSDIHALSSMWAEKNGKQLHIRHSSLTPSTPDTLIPESYTFGDFESASAPPPQKTPLDLRNYGEPFHKDQFMSELTRALAQRPPAPALGMPP